MQTIPMILRSFRRTTEGRSIAALYGTIVAQARTAAFYTQYGVADTLEGRFELIVLHVVLLLRRLSSCGEPGRGLGQQLFDVFCRDLDGNLREMGIGDLAVPKHMRRFGEAFYGRQAAYLAALQSPDPAAFANALGRNIFVGANVEQDAARLARYAWALAREFDAQEDAAFTRGAVRLPNPEAFVHAPA